MSVVDDLADKLARDTIKAMDALGDENLPDQVAAVLGASSPSSEEIFRAAVRIRLAERRARTFLNDHVQKALDAKNAARLYRRHWHRGRTTKTSDPALGPEVCRITTVQSTQCASRLIGGGRASQLASTGQCPARSRSPARINSASTSRSTFDNAPRYRQDLPRLCGPSRDRIAL